MAKKVTPTEQFDPQKVRELQQRKEIDRQNGRIDQSEGRDTRMSRDGGTTRRVRR